MSWVAAPLSILAFCIGIAVIMGVNLFFDDREEQRQHERIMTGKENILCGDDDLEDEVENATSEANK